MLMIWAERIYQPSHGTSLCYDLSKGIGNPHKTLRELPAVEIQLYGGLERAERSLYPNSLPDLPQNNSGHHHGGH